MGWTGIRPPWPPCSVSSQSSPTGYHRFTLTEIAAGLERRRAGHKTRQALARQHRALHPGQRRLRRPGGAGGLRRSCGQAGTGCSPGQPRLAYDRLVPRSSVTIAGGMARTRSGPVAERDKTEAGVMHARARRVLSSSAGLLQDGALDIIALVSIGYYLHGRALDNNPRRSRAVKRCGIGWNYSSSCNVGGGWLLFSNAQKNRDGRYLSVHRRQLSKPTSIMLKLLMSRY